MILTNRHSAQVIVQIVYLSLSDCDLKNLDIIATGMLRCIYMLSLSLASPELGNSSAYGLVNSA